MAAFILSSCMFLLSSSFRSVEDESAEYHFCESRQLNMSTLRMTSEAKVRSCTVLPPLCTVLLLFHSHTSLATRWICNAEVPIKNLCHAMWKANRSASYLPREVFYPNVLTKFGAIAREHARDSGRVYCIANVECKVFMEQGKKNSEWQTELLVLVAVYNWLFFFFFFFAASAERSSLHCWISRWYMFFCYWYS